MKASVHLTILSLVSLFSLGLRAADVTFDEPTVYTEDGSFDNVNVNSTFQLGSSEKTGGLTLTDRKYVNVPGADGKDATFTFCYPTLGKGLAYGGSNAGFTINGRSDGRGKVIVGPPPAGVNRDVELGRVQFGKWGLAHETGYADALEICNGREAAGHWHITSAYKILNQRTDNLPVRIRFCGLGGVLHAGMSARFADSLFVNPVAGARTVLEGDGADIVFECTQWQANSPKWTSILRAVDAGKIESGVLRTQGDCDLVFFNTHESAAGDLEYGFSLDAQIAPERLEWAHTGATVVSNAVCLRVASDYLLPHGTQTGRIEFRASNWKGYPSIDLRGTTQKVNGIWSAVPTCYETAHLGAHNSMVTNTSDTAATLIVGADGLDGDLCVGHIGGGVTVLKAGTGTVEVSRVLDMEDVEVVGGTLKYLSDTRVGAITVSAGVLVVSNCLLTCESIAVTGAEVLVDGGKLVCGSANTAAGGSIRCVNGGTVVGAESADVRVELQNGGCNLDRDLAAGGNVSLVKNGANETKLFRGGAFAAVDVAAGTLRVGGEMVADRFWRFTFTETAAAAILAWWNGGSDKTVLSRTVSFALNRIHLLTADGQIANTGVITGTIGIEPKDLPVGRATMNRQFAEVGGVSNGAGGRYDSLKHLSFGLSESSYIGVALADEKPVTTESPAVLTFHLNDNNLAPCGYLFANAVNSGTAGAPVDWTVDSSTDGVTWTPRDSRADHPLDRTAGPETYWENGVPFLFTSAEGTWSFSSSRASVASGATLDLSNVPAANVAISGLEVDCTGAGEIAGGVFAANGTLYLKNAPQFDRKLELPITLTDPVGTENLASWTVCVDDAPLKDCRVVWRNGKLVAKYNQGLIVVIQ